MELKVDKVKQFVLGLSEDEIENIFGCVSFTNRMFNFVSNFDAEDVEFPNPKYIHSVLSESVGSTTVEMGNKIEKMNDFFEEKIG